jgi:hypothetical protein
VLDHGNHDSGWLHRDRGKRNRLEQAWVPHHIRCRRQDQRKCGQSPQDGLSRLFPFLFQCSATCSYYSSWRSPLTIGVSVSCSCSSRRSSRPRHFCLFLLCRSFRPSFYLFLCLTCLFRSRRVLLFRFLFLFRMGHVRQSKQCAAAAASFLCHTCFQR